MEPEAYEFGGIRVDLRTLTVTRDGQPVALEPKAFDVLRYLIEHSDRVVTKDEVLEHVWPQTFVTPNVLTRAIAQLRKALGDEAFDARIIETIAKRGYRFVAAIEPAGVHSSHPPPSLPPSHRPEPSHPRFRFLVVAAVGLLALVAAISAQFLWRKASGSDPLPAPVFTRLTTSAGYSGMAAVSPDGKSLAYVSDRSGALEIYVTSFAFGSDELAITNDGGNNMDPAWSPDGQWIAFHSRARRGIWVVPATGGTPRQVVDFGSQPCWSPDGSQIAFSSDAGGGNSQSVIWLVSRDGGTRRQLTKVGGPPSGQGMPAWSRDGRYIVFSVSMARREPALAFVSVADGDVRQFRMPSTAVHPQFSRDGRAIFWVELWQSESRLMRMAIGPDGMPTGAAEFVRALDSGLVDGLSIADEGTTAVSIARDEWNIWAIEIPNDRASRAVGEPVRLTNDVARVGRPDYSTDERIAFIQFMPGRPISSWLMNGDGSRRAPLLDPPTANPEWTRDGQSIIVIHGPDSQYWRVDPETRRGTPLALAATGMSFPRISPDGRAVAYHVIQADGTLNVWIRPLNGGPAKQITFDKDPMGFPAWSPDGKWLAVQMMRGDHTFMGVVPSEGGTFDQLVFEPGQSFIHSWSPDGNEIAFAGERNGVWNIYAVSRLTKKIRQFTYFSSSTGYVRYPSWSPRGARIAFERNIRTGSISTGRLP